MSRCKQGDILEEALAGDYDVAVVFGGMYGGMAHDWNGKHPTVTEWQGIENPFEAYGNNPMGIKGNTQWWWFIPAEYNAGVNKEHLLETFKRVFDWARKKKLKSVITNGFWDTGRGSGKDVNRVIDDRRVNLIKDTMVDFEREGFKVTLISRDDSYIR